MRFFADNADYKRAVESGDDAGGEKHPVEQIAEACGGKIDSGGILPDGSGFAVVSFPLSKSHWIYQRENDDAPPMTFRLGEKDQASLLIQRNGSAREFSCDPPIRMTREEFAAKIYEIGKYAVRASTMHGAEMDFDPDAMLQNLVVGALGYHTDDGLSSLEDWMNPPHLRDSSRHPSTGSTTAKVDL